MTSLKDVYETFARWGLVGVPQPQVLQPLVESGTWDRMMADHRNGATPQEILAQMGQWVEAREQEKKRELAQAQLDHEARAQRFVLSKTREEERRRQAYRDQVGDQIRQLQQLEARARQAAGRHGNLDDYQRIMRAFNRTFGKTQQMVDHARAVSPPGALSEEALYIQGKSLGLG